MAQRWRFPSNNDSLFFSILQFFVRKKRRFCTRKGVFGRAVRKIGPFCTPTDLFACSVHKNAPLRSPGEGSGGGDVWQNELANSVCDLAEEFDADQADFLFLVVLLKGGEGLLERV